MNHVMKTFTSVLLGAAALVALTTGCVREPASNNPNFDPEKNTVNTKFVLSINNKSDGTKMTADNVQAGGNNFLGMQDVHILTYELDEHNTPSFAGAPATTAETPVVGKFFFQPHLSTEPLRQTTATADYNFGSLFEANGITTEKQSRTLELAFPLNTNAVVIYGKALNTQGPENQGASTASGNPSNLASLKFGLTPRIDPISEAGKKPFLAGAVVLQSILTSVTLSALVDEKHYWTTTGNKGTQESDYIDMSNGGSDLEADRRYRVWLPYQNRNQADYPIANLTKDNGGYYEDGETYQPAGSSTIYTMRSGNCSWKMLGDMYWAMHDGSDVTTVEYVASTCGAGSLQFSPLLELLGQAYHNLITISTREEWKDPDNQDLGTITYHELRAGSAAAILRTLRDLDFIVHKCIDAEPTSWSEMVAKELAREIDSRLDLFFTGHKDEMLYRSSQTITSKLTQNGADLTEICIDGVTTEQTGYGFYFSDQYLKSVGSGSTLDGSAGFPMNIGLPMGSAYLETDSGGYQHLFHPDRFLFKENIPAYAFGIPNSTFNIFNYCYPPELMYYGNSPLRVSDSEHTENQYPLTLSEWNNDACEKWTGWTKFGNVTSETKSVAMAMPINYGTALLKSTVKYHDEVATNGGYLYDNNGGIHSNEDPKPIRVIGTPQDPVTTGIIVTGIVIGGQPKAVTWDYTRMPDHTEDEQGNVIDAPSYQDVTFDPPIGTADEIAAKVGKFSHLLYDNDQFGMMIYDKVATANQFRIGDSQSAGIIYTLCWDNYDATKYADEQDDVYIAIELRNETGADFWGETNLIRKGGTFYLVGKLNLAAQIAAPGDNTPYKVLKNSMARSDYYYPPFNPQTGETIKVPRVFMQDYVTTATLTLKQDALQHAYMTVPDLRSNQVSLGVSVDINWETGLTFDVNMGVIE